MTTRGQLTKMLALGFGWTLYNPVYPDFSDVPADHPYYLYVETAYSHGVVTGYADSTFRPGSAVTRAQVTKMLVISKGWMPYYPLYPDFSDVPADHWAYGYVEAAYSSGVVSGYSNGTFMPGATVTRAQFSKMLTLTLQQTRGVPQGKSSPPASIPPKAPANPVSTAIPVGPPITQMLTDKIERLDARFCLLSMTKL